MKHLLMVILAVAVLVVAVTGCGRTPRYDGRLMAADSLMRTDPDSALAIVGAIDRDSLGGEGDRAYRDLLLTQARYKAYVPATSDSDINRALAYYRAHPKEREKLTRAYIYKGAVMEELGHPDSAMLYYKHAETTAAPDDYFNLGYINLRIGQLYQSQFASDSAVVYRMRCAQRYFTVTRDTSFLTIAVGTIGGYSSIISKDSARRYLLTAINFAKDINSPKCYQYQSKLAGTYFYDGDYQRALDLAMYIFRNGRDICNEQQFYYYAALSYIHLNHIDSARWLVSVIPPPINAVDSMNNFQVLAELAKADGHIKEYGLYSDSANKINTRLLENAKNSRLAGRESACESHHLKNEIESKSKNRMAFIIGSALLIMIFTAIRIIKIISRRYQSELDACRSELNSMLEEFGQYTSRLEDEQKELLLKLAARDQELADLNKYNGEFLSRQYADVSRQVSSIVRYRRAAINELYNSIRVKIGTASARNPSVPLISMIKDLLDNKQILSKPPGASFWENLKLSVDGEFLGIASYVESNYPTLTEKDRHLFLLLCAGFPNQIIKLCMNYSQDATISRNKKKMMCEKFGLDMKFNEFISHYVQENTLNNL